MTSQHHLLICISIKASRRNCHFATGDKGREKRACGINMIYLDHHILRDFKIPDLIIILADVTVVHKHNDMVHED